MKIGRNDSCSCGIQKKYKHCCLKKEIFSSSQKLPVMTQKDNPAYFQMRLAEATVIEKHLKPFLLKSPVLSKELYLSVSQYTKCIEDSEFYNDDEFIDHMLVETVIPWCLFVHKIDGVKTLAEIYKKNHYTRLNSREQEFLESAMAGYYNFYMVTEVKQGWGLTLKDLFLEKEYIYATLYAKVDPGAFHNESTVVGLDGDYLRS